ncbi:MAG: tripartite tricarboxylate transporter substrate binding protein [Burkholderiales bacterium]
MRHLTLARSAISALAALAAGAVSAAGWTPQQTVEFVAPNGPGSSMDNNVRLIHKLWSDVKDKAVTGTVINRAGGEHMLAYNYIKQRSGNPHFLGLATSVLLTSHISGRSAITYTDVTPLATLSTEWTYTAVRTESPFKTGKDMIDALKKEPASLSIGYASTTHRIAAVLPMKMENVDVKSVRMPVFGGGKSIVMLLGGHADVVLTTFSQIAAHVEAGKVRVIAVSSPKRLPGMLASVPTWEELGYKGGSGSWRSVIAPKGLTPEQVAYWENALQRITQSDEFRKDVERNHGHITYRSAAETVSFMEAEYGEMKSVLTYLGLAKQ